MNSRCYSDFEHDSYLCACSPGFTGERCEAGESNVLSTADGRVLFSFYYLVFRKNAVINFSLQFENEKGTRPEYYRI